MFVKFWGARGSIPTPISAAAIKDKITRALQGASGLDLNDPKVVGAYVNSLPFAIQGTAGGNTACVEVITGDQHIILDAGSGLRELGLSLLQGPFGRGQGTAHIFLSHIHWDHIQGFPFFVPAYIPGNRIFFYSPRDDIEEKLKLQQTSPSLFPIKLGDMAAHKEFVTLSSENVRLGDVTVACSRQHHPGDSYAYRIEHGEKSLVYATDSEYKNLGQEALQPHLDFFAGADLLIFDAQYTFAESVAKEDWGHSTAMVGVDMAIKTGVKRLALFHYDPTYSDDKLKEIKDKTVAYCALVPGDNNLEISLAIEGLGLTL
jgi:phosphoribosyl 1,2-cyclic phosphodiesterase